MRCQFKDILNLFPVLQHTYKNAPNTNSFVLFDNIYCLWQLNRNINEKALWTDYHFILNSKTFVHYATSFHFLSSGFEKKKMSMSVDVNVNKNYFGMGNSIHSALFLNSFHYSDYHPLVTLVKILLAYNFFAWIVVCYIQVTPAP